MEIVNGRWVHKGERVNDFNYKELKKIADAVVSLYGKDITHERIRIITSIKNFDDKKEKEIVKSLENSIAL